MQCQFYSWEECYTEIAHLLDTSSPINENFNQCVASANQTRAEKITLQLDAGPPQPDVLHLDQPSLTPPMNTLNKSCLISKSDKVSLFSSFMRYLQVCQAQSALLYIHPSAIFMQVKLKSHENNFYNIHTSSFN